MELVHQPQLPCKLVENATNVAACHPVHGWDVALELLDNIIHSFACFWTPQHLAEMIAVPPLQIAKYQ